ncbi:tripartite tricarboxylate transporter substrate binding protein [Sediminicoccus rosea]|jgi:tripartite-type tricarboxylate transporter receptor subunit TctC|uniref:Tripartite tricarboxylate transporter substrate binding protein n=1 Tax=Sediminicoccus rosea TaxID=1225128 RepID=A0ABZ0PNC8_9PROT|nr:tripartite tricarboxylate transporter substrate binding protein [Sediminicoccus rosea]WPB87240.1 tripartite tricarboxylate transporter substrate binding protein [Sediminicoccus rosea]
MPVISRRHALILPGAAALAAPAYAQQNFPNRPIRMIVPWGAGGTTDVQMRAYCEAASRRLGQPIVVENRAGAGGVLGAQALLTAAPDGYTLSQMPISVFRQPLLNSRALFDPLTDFTYVIHVTGYLFGIVVRNDAPWQTLADLIAAARREPGKLNYGTPGVGTSLHLTMEQIAQMQRIEWTHIPFRGVAENLQNLLGGQIQITADSSGWVPMAEEGRVRVLATWGESRAKRFPNVPTLKESGIDIVSISPYGLAGPKNMDPGVVRVLHDAFREALGDPSHVAVLERFDMQPNYKNSADYTAFVRQTMEEERRLIQQLGLRLS